MIHKSKGWVGLVVIVASLSLQYPVFAQDDAASGNVVYLPVVQSNISNDSSNAVAAAAPTPPVVVSAVATVDMTDDPKGLGYPDSRKIAQDTSGNPVIAYRKSSPPVGSCSSTAQHIFVARKSSSPAWIPERIDNGLCKTQRVPSISIDAQNKLLVSWYGQQNSATQTNDRQIFFSQSTAFNSWSTPALPNVIAFPISGTFPTLWQEHPVIFASPLNTIDILWQSRDASHLANSLIRFTRSTNGTSWTNVTLPDAVLDGTTTLTGGDFSRPTMGSTAAGSKLFALAYTSIGSNLNNIVWIKSANNGTSWGTDSTSSDGKWKYVAKVTGSGNEQRHVSAAVDTAFRVHAVWRQVNSTTYRAYYSVYDSNWAATAQPLPLANSGFLQLYPSVTVYKVGTIERVAAVWLETNNASFPGSDEELASGTVYLSVRNVSAANDTASWSTPIAISGNNARFASLRWGWNNTNSIDAVWLEGAIDASFKCSPTCNIRYARYQ